MKKNKITATDKKKIYWILENVENKQAFLKSLIDSFIIALEQNNVSYLRDNIEIWMASAEIDSIPGAKDNIHKSYNEFKSEKNISRDWSGFLKNIGVSQSK